MYSLSIIHYSASNIILIATTVKKKKWIIDSAKNHY